MTPEQPLQLEVWSDVICPWCYIGKRRLERALERFEHAAEVEVVWRSFQLDPAYPAGLGQDVSDVLAAKFGASPEQVKSMTDRVSELAAAEGLVYALERSKMANTYDAHRLTQLARDRGLGGEMHERLLRAHLAEGEQLDDAETLVRLGAETGVPAEQTRRLLASDDYADAVEADLAEARRLGVSGVPFFVLDRRFALSGAQAAEVFLGALRTAFAPSSGSLQPHAG